MAGPFFPGAGTSPFRLEGRDRELRTWHRMLTDIGVFGHTQERQLILQGVRGVGKTSLLKQFAEDAVAQGGLAVRVRCQASAREPLMERVRAAVQQTLQRPPDFTDVHGRVVRAAITTPVGGLEVERELRPESPGLTDTAFMQELVDATTEVRRRGGLGLALLVDETQYADQASLVNLSELVSLIGERDGDKPPLLLCFAGLPDTVEKVGRSSSHAERVYRTLELGYLDADSTRDAFLLPVHEAGGRWTPEALTEAVTVSGGYPAFIQEYGQAFWELRRGDLIDADVVAEGVRAAGPQIEAYFQGAWNAAPPLGRSALLELARAGGRLRMRELATALGRGSSSEISWAVDELRRRGTVTRPERGVVVFGRPGMREWVLAQQDDGDDR
ncbi:ATP-binding protein [Desertihabitans aurantiacus]|uniref:ATP-binding protein n=1 Tax=Desertihabitans aurantiacus TaxID=2282477 RepID=UPI0013008624|nr:ATP-binding protein [Desertihabitans aurantiacus]